MFEHTPKPTGSYLKNASSKKDWLSERGGWSNPVRDTQIQGGPPSSF